MFHVIKAFCVCLKKRFFLFYFMQLPTNAQLINKLSHSSYVFRHYCVFFRGLGVSTSVSYTSTSNVVLIETRTDVIICEIIVLFLGHSAK